MLRRALPRSITLPRSRLRVRYFARDLPGIFVFSQRNEPRMSQVIVRRPLGELEQPHQHWLYPLAFFHLCGSEPLPPAPASGLGEIRERALCDFQTAKPLQQIFPQPRREAVASPRDVQKLGSLVISKDQSIKRRSAQCVPGDYEFLALVDSHLLPGARALAWLIPAVTALGNQPLEPLRAHGGHQILEARSQFRRLPYGLAQLGKNVSIQEVPPGTQRHSHHVTAGKDQDIENIV